MVPLIFLNLEETKKRMIQKERIPAKPKIAILTNYPYDGKSFSGGVETATSALLEGLEKHSGEFEFHILALAREIRTHTVESRNGIVFHFIAIPSRWFARPHLIPNILNARAELKKLQADLVHCQDNMALAIGAITAHPSKRLFTVHGIKSVESRVWEGPEYWSHQMDALLERLVRQRFEEVITISPYVDRFLPIHVKKHHIPNAVKSIFFDVPRDGRDAQHLLFVGVLTRLKRPLDVIRAFAIVKQGFSDATLSLVGQVEDVAYEREMRQYIANAQLEEVEFLGSRTQQDIASLMRRSTVLVLASVQENTPMVIAEAMASGLPVIASRVGGVPLMVKDNVDGLLFECGDTEGLAGQITRVFGDAELRERLSKNGREKAMATYSADAVASATVNVYRSILGA
jgi:glycosyltransferase involved in cell wall biosynthesis